MKNIFTKAIGVIVMLGLFVAIALPARAQTFTKTVLENNVFYFAMTSDKNGNVYAIRSSDILTIHGSVEVVKFLAGQSTYTPILTGLTDDGFIGTGGDSPEGLAVNSSGDVYLTTDFAGNNVINGTTLTGSSYIIKLAATGGINGTSYAASVYQNAAVFYSALAFDSSDNLYACQMNAANTTYTVTEYTKTTPALAAGTALISGLNDFFVNGNAGLTSNYPTGLAVASNGDIYVNNPTLGFLAADAGSPPAGAGGDVRHYTQSSGYTSFTDVSTGKYAFALGLDPSGNLYISQTDGSYYVNYELDKYTAANLALNTNGGGGATKIVAMDQADAMPPMGIAAVATNNIYALDGGDPGAIWQFTGVQASSISFSGTTSTGTTINWTSGAGSSRAVFVEQGSSGSPTPAAGTTYAASTSFGSGTQAGSGWFCVYNGSSNSVTVSNLAANTTYRVMVLEFNGTSAYPDYQTSSATSNPANFTTATPAITAPGGTVTVPSTVETVSGSSTSFSISGSNLAGNITATAPTHFQVSNNNSTWGSTATFTESGGTLSSTPVYVRLDGTGTVGGQSGSVALSSSSATTVNQAVSGTLLQPTITAPGGTTTLTATASGTAGASVSFNISGSNLLGNITATAPTNVQVSSDNVTFGSTATIIESGGTLSSTPVYVRLAGTGTVGTISGNVALSSSNANTINQAVSGTLNAPAAATSTGISSSNNPSFTAAPNNSVTFTATVTSTSTVNEGTVTFTSNGLAITGGTNVAVSNGVATVTTSFATAGPYTILATYNGTANFTTSSNSLTQQANIHPTTISSLTAVNSTLTNLASVQYTATFATAISGLTASNFTFTGGAGSVGSPSVTSVSPSSGSSTTFTITVNTGSGDGSLQLVFANATGLSPSVSNTGFAGTTYTIDKTAPTVSIGPPSSAYAKSGTTVSYSISWSDANLNVGSIAAGGLSGNVSHTGVTFTSINFLPGTGGNPTTVQFAGLSGNGTLSFFVPAGSATDNAGNAAAASSQSASVIVDSNAPTISISPPSVSLTTGGPVTYTVTYNDANFNSSTLSSSDITLNNGGSSASASSIVVGGGSGTTRTVTLSGITGDGTLGITIGAGTATDLAGNSAPASSPSTTFTVDNTPPTVSSITATTPSNSSPTNATSVSYTVTFSEAVTNVSNAAFTAITSSVSTTGITVSPVSSSVYTVTVNGISGTGTLGLNLNGSGTGITDLAGNAISGGGFTGDVYNIDNTPPTVSSVTATTPSNTNPTNATSVSYTVTFSEPVTGVAPQSFTATTSGVSATGILVTPVTSSVYTVTVTGISGDGTLRLDVKSANNNIFDAAFNPMTTGFTGDVYNIDNTPPTALTLAAQDPTPTNETQLDYTITFSEAVTGVDPGDFTAVTSSGISAGAISVTQTSASTYNLSVPVSGSGTVQVNLNSTGTGIADIAGNPISGGINGDVFTVDQTPPTVSAITATTPSNTNPTNSTTLAYTVTFSEAVTGVDNTDFTGNNLTGSVSYSSITVTPVSSSVYTVTLNGISGDGTMRLDLNGSGTGITDLVGNAITGGFTGDVYTIDNTPPTALTLIYKSNNANSQLVAKVGDVITLDFTASEAIQAPSLTIAGQSITAVNTTGNEWVGTYTLTSGDTEGRIPFSLSFSDLAGNPQPGVPYNDVNAGDDIEFDKTPPTVFISAPSVTSIGNNGIGTVTYTVTYADANFNTSNLTNAGITLNTSGTANGSAVVSGSGASYTVTISSITGIGTLGITVAAGAASDLAGNTDAGQGPSTTFNVLASDATLSGLTLSHGTLSPAFNTGTTGYTAHEFNGTQTITVTPSTTDPNATILINGSIPVTSGAASSPITLTVGSSNTISIAVTAQDGVTTKTYTVTVTRAPSSNDNLAGLTMDHGVLSPSFTKGNTSYTASVGNTVSMIAVKAALSDATALLKIDGSVVSSGVFSSGIPLTVGNNTITVTIKAQDNISTKTYTVIVNRAPSTNDKLALLQVSKGIFGPAFSAGNTSYTDAVGNTISSVTVTPTTADPTATVQVNGITVTSGTPSGPVNVPFGPSTINVKVTAQDGSTNQTYAIAVSRPANSDADLSALHMSMGRFGWPFDPNVTTYADTVSNDKTMIKVIPTTRDTGARVTVNGIAVVSGTESGPVSLVFGNNPILVVVTAEDGTTKTYTVNVLRPVYDRDNLVELKVSKGIFSPVFDSGTTSYTDNVGNSISSITVTPTVGNATATIKVNGLPVASGTASGPINLAVGSTTIHVVVKAQDSIATKTYTITVNRASGSVDSYQGISVTKPTETPALAEDGVQVHQGISPNGDGINDYLQIDNISQYPNNKLSIMNRNGQLIYEASGYDNSSKVFDGHSNKNGQMQLPGTYFYQLDYTVNGIIRHKTGFLVLKY